MCIRDRADEAFRNEHSKILLQTSNGLREYQIAAVLKTDITKFRFNRTEFCLLYTSIKTKEKLYFAYGSNMNLNQMAFRCPDAEVVESVRLEGYRLAFRTNGGGNGVATILPKEGSYVDGVLWRISERDEQHLDHYEGFPFLYGKEPVTVTNQDGVRREIKDAAVLFQQSFQPRIPRVHGMRHPIITYFFR